VHEPLLPQPFPQAFHGPGSLVLSRVAKTSGDFLLLYFLRTCGLLVGSRKTGWVRWYRPVHRVSIKNEKLLMKIFASGEARAGHSVALGAGPTILPLAPKLFPSLAPQDFQIPSGLW